MERLDYANAPGLAAWSVGIRVFGMAPREGIVLSSWDRFVVPAARSAGRG